MRTDTHLCVAFVILPGDWIGHAITDHYSSIPHYEDYRRPWSNPILFIARSIEQIESSLESQQAIRGLNLNLFSSLARSIKKEVLSFHWRYTLSLSLPYYPFLTVFSLWQK